MSKRTIFTRNEIVNCGDYSEIILYNRYGEEIKRTKIDNHVVSKVKDIKWGIGSGDVSHKDRRENFKLHRFLYSEFIEEIPNGSVIVHLNGDKFDNRLSNLKIMTRSESEKRTNQIYEQDYIREDGWKDLNFKDFGRKYEINEFGVIRNKFTKKVVEPHLNRFGYVRVNLYPIGNSRVGKKTSFVHRLVALTFIENTNETVFTDVNHIDGNKENNHVSNLEWCDRTHNVRHSFEIGLHDEDVKNRRERMSGQNHKLALFTNEQVKNMFVDYFVHGMTTSQLAEKYNTHVAQVGRIIRQERWKSVTDDLVIKYNIDLKRRNY